MKDAAKPVNASVQLDHIDGLRAVAILWVAIYHYAVFWAPAGAGTNLLPYGDALAFIPFANVGYLGVYLFFIVSGFVISLSLTRSSSIGRFGINRGIRLWPTLLLCGALTYLVTSLFGPASLIRSPMEYLISMTFIPPAHIGKALGIADLEWLDGAYWSLWTEVRFYIVAAFLYFSGRSNFLLRWSIFSIVSAAVHIVGLQTGGVFDALSRLLFAEHQPFFTAGIALAALHSSRGNPTARNILLFAIVQAFAYPWLVDGHLAMTEIVGIGLVFLLAIPTMLSRGPHRILSSPVLVTIGIASYAYYLLHQNTGLALLVAFGTGSNVVSIATMLVIQLGLLGVAILLTQKIETPIRKDLRMRMSRLNRS